MKNNVIVLALGLVLGPLGLPDIAQADEATAAPQARESQRPAIGGQGSGLHPVIPSVSSFFIPGVGQWLNGDTQKGWIHFAGGLVIPLASTFVTMSLAMQDVTKVTSADDLANIANRSLMWGLINTAVIMGTRGYSAYEAYQGAGRPQPLSPQPPPAMQAISQASPEGRSSQIVGYVEWPWGNPDFQHQSVVYTYLLVAESLGRQTKSNVSRDALRVAEDALKHLRDGDSQKAKALLPKLRSTRPKLDERDVRIFIDDFARFIVAQ